MKRCPQCKTTYSDDTLNFCLEDGKWLVGDVEPATAILEAEPPTLLVDSTERQSLSAHRAAQPEERAASFGSESQRSTFPKLLLFGSIALAVIMLAGFA